MLGILPVTPGPAGGIVGHSYGRAAVTRGLRDAACSAPLSRVRRDDDGHSCRGRRPRTPLPTISTTCYRAGFPLREHFRSRGAEALATDAAPSASGRGDRLELLAVLKTDRLLPLRNRQRPRHVPAPNAATIYTATTTPTATPAPLAVRTYCDEVVVPASRRAAAIPIRFLAASLYTRSECCSPNAGLSTIPDCSAAVAGVAADSATPAVSQIAICPPAALARPRPVRPDSPI